MLATKNLQTFALLFNLCWTFYAMVIECFFYASFIMIKEVDSFLIFRLFLEGDILSWDRENWILRSPYNRSEMEFLDLEYDICSQSDDGLFLVPQKMSVSEGHHVCDKLSGEPVSYRNRVEMGKISK